MPATPATWLNDFVVNLTTADVQANPRVTQLANGNILVVWDSTDNTGVGSPAGIDVIGQVFDPLGTPVGAEVRLNIDSTVNDERNADVAALPDGGFVVVYQRTNGNIFDLLVEQFDATGAYVRGGTFAFDSTSGVAPSNFPPVVAVSSATSALLVWEQSEVGGQSQILGVVYNPTTGLFGSDFTVIEFGGTNRSPAVTVLNNGTYVIAAATDVGGNQFITYRIVNPAGGNVLPATQLSSTVGDAEFDGDPSITALTDGGFVITWTNTDASDTDIMVQRFDLNGNVVDGAFEVTSVSGVDSAADPVTVALLDGGYLVIWNDTGSTPGLRVRHFSASGILQGEEYTIFGDFVADPDAVRLADGRVAVTFRDAAGEIRMEIIDTRDTANATGVYTPQSWQIGTIGDDTFTGDGVASFVHGHDGNDTINSGANGLTATYFGGAGNDVINVVASVDPDAFQGNAGNDLIDWTASGFVGGTFNLTTGQFTDGFETRVMTGFEHLTGTGGDDTITGTTGANSLSGGFGDDRITGGLGDDTLLGGGNADVQSGGSGNDSLDGGLGEDSLFGGDNDDVLSGGGDHDALFGGDGDDRFEATGDGQLNANNGDGGNDTFALSNVHFSGHIFGGAGTADHVDGSGSVDFALVIDLAAQFYNDGGQFTLMGVENATGGGQADRITGDANANTLAGGLGNDTLFAGTGSDRMSGDAGNDTLTGDGAGADTFFGGADTDTLDLSGSAAAFTFNTQTGLDAVLTGLLFQQFEVFLFGAQADVISTHGTITVVETVFGGAGNDTVIDTGSTTSGAQDSYDGGIGIDTLVYTNLGSTVRTVDMVQGILFSNTDVRDTFTGFENITITLGANNIIGDGADNILTAQGNFVNSISGGAGNDTIDGGEGADSLFGGTGNDVLRFGTGAATVQGDAGNDIYAFTTGLTDLNDTSGTADVADFTAWSGAVGININLGSRLLGTSASPGSNSVEGIEHVQGSTLADLIRGDAGANSLAGNNGADSILGLGGNDTLFGDGGADTLFGGGDDDTLRGGAAADTMFGDDGNDTFLVDGGGFSDDSFGGAGNDRFALADAFDMGDFDGGGDLADLIDGSAVTTALTVNLGVGSYTLRTPTFTLLNTEHATGGSAGDTITGSTGANILNGNGGDDTLIGGMGNDVITGGGDADRLEGGDQHDELYGGNGIDSLFGGEGDDYLDSGLFSESVFGGGGNDVLFVGANEGNDNLFGGTGLDTADLYALETLNLRVDLVAGTWGEVTMVFGVLDDIENAFSSFGNDVLIGDGEANTFVADMGNDSLNGGGGTDTLFGGFGNDTLIGGNGRDSLSGGAGNDDFGTITGATGFDDIDGGANFDRVSFAGTTADMQIFPDAYSDGGQHFALAGVEDVTSGSGNDRFTISQDTNIYRRIDAGDGNDLVLLQDLTVTVIGGAGRDRIDLGSMTTNLTFNLGTNLVQSGFEDVILGQGSDSGTGTDGINSLAGSSGNDTLFGLGDDDVLLGQGHNDTLFGGSGNDRLEGDDGNDRLDGGANDDILFGGANADRLEGGDGNDYLDGGVGGGVDSLTGGNGNDTVIVGDGADITSGGADSDLLVMIVPTASVTFNMTTGVTNGFGTHTLYERVQMGSGDDTVFGTAGNDLINGHVGSDHLFGGAGNDILSGDTAGLAPGTNRLEGGSGNDTLQHFAGVVALFGGTDSDLIELFTQGGLAVTGTLDGGTGTDRLNLANLANGQLQGASLTGIEILETGATPTTATAAQFEGFDTIRLSDTDSTGAVRLILAATGAATVLDLTDELARAGGARSVTLTGSTDHETLRGGAGVDSISAGAGFDTVIGGHGADVTNGGADFDTLDMRSLTTALTFNMATGATNGFGTHTGYEAIQAGSGNDTLTGDGQGNEIYGGAGRNTINGAGGDDNFEEEDTLLDRADGGTGQDDVSVKTQLATGTVINLSTGQVTLGATTLTQWTNFEDLAIYGGNSAVTVIGTDGVNNFGAYGGTGAERFEGRGGNDFLSSGAGNDALFGGDGNDYMVGYQGDDTLDGGIGDDYLDSGGGLFNDTLFGGTGNDTLFGSEGQNLIETGTGVDRASGSGGNDVIIVADLTDSLIDAGDGTDTLVVNFAGAHTFNMATGAITNGGPALALQWQGFEHYRNTSGGASSETVIGSTGDNTISFEGTTGAHSAHGDAGHDVLRGGSGVDRLSGSDGNDSLDGGAGVDQLFGGANDDDFGTITAATGVDLLDGGTGTDRVVFAGGDVAVNLFTQSYAFGTAPGTGLIGVEIVTTGGGNDTITTALTTLRIDAGAGNDTVRLLALSTTALGGLGVDRLDVSGIAGDRLFNLATAALQTGFEHLLLGAGNDSATGTATANSLDGGAGNDTLTGGDGDDALAGGDGADRLAGDGGNDGLTGGDGDDALAGSDGADRLAGDGGNDALAGGAGNDSLTGGAGADVLAGDAGADALIGGSGNDRLAGGTGDDRLTGQGGADRLLGAVGADRLVGGGGADNLSGGGGADRATGGGGADVVKGGGGEDILTGGGGGDRLVGGGGGDTLNGGSGADVLVGGGGGDRLDGAKGNDVLTGNAGADVFVFGRGAGQDQVTSFANGADRVDLTGPLTFADLTETAIAGGVRLTIAATPAHHIDLLGVTVAQINAGDFI